MNEEIHAFNNGMSDSDPIATFRYGAERLSELGIGYLHVYEQLGDPGAADAPPRVLPHLRKAFRGPIVLNGGRDLTTGNAALAEGEADAIAFAQKFLANPDLPERFAASAPLNEPDTASFYSGGARGYVDYPSLEQVGAGASR